VVSVKESNEGRQIYFVGGGLASLSGAVYLIRDGCIPGKDIHIIEELPVLGGSNDGAGDALKGYTIRGGRMLNDETYENTWELLKSIPSIDNQGKSVRDDIIAFDTANQTNAKARLIDINGKILDNFSMGYSTHDRSSILKLILSSENSLGKKKINDCFDEHFFQTNFWYMFSTTFAFQPWHSAVECKRYILRFLHELPHLSNLAGLTRTPYNQYDSIILPLQKYLENTGVDFNLKCTITDIDFKEADEITATSLYYSRDGKSGEIKLNNGDLVFVTNGCMTDTHSWGTMTSPPEHKEKGNSFKLWDKIAAKKTGLGNPSAFDENIPETAWGSFTVTCEDSKFFELMEKFTGNRAGTGALVTFKDSNWYMSLVLAYQPHFRNQPENVSVFFGNGLSPFKEGNYVKKRMCDCTGQEIMTELLNHLHFNEEDKAHIMKTVNCLPCFTPFVTAQFMPRMLSDRPRVVPEGSTNVAFIGQFCEIADDVVFTEEYSVRAARTAVYTLLKIDKKVEPVTKYHRQLKVLIGALKTSYR
jgi:oleate hydratase